uniref:Uncharacterized protein n=1 Tax=Magallana gigas TaxID=29159 RepID=K1PTE0_MAGGI
MVSLCTTNASYDAMWGKCSVPSRVSMNFMTSRLVGKQSSPGRHLLDTDRHTFTRTAKASPLQAKEL